MQTSSSMITVLLNRQRNYFISGLCNAKLVLYSKRTPLNYQLSTNTKTAVWLKYFHRRKLDQNFSKFWSPKKTTSHKQNRQKYKKLKHDCQITKTGIYQLFINLTNCITWRHGCRSTKSTGQLFVDYVTQKIHSILNQRYWIQKQVSGWNICIDKESTTSLWNLVVP